MKMKMKMRIRPIIMQKICAIILISGVYFIFMILREILHNEIIVRIPVFMGGASAIYFLFLARTHFSKLATLYSVLQSSCYLFVVNHVHTPDIAILVVICICFSFFFSFFFVSERISMDEHLEKCFVLLLVSRFFMSPEMVPWGIALVLELIFLFGFHYRESQEDYQHRNRKGVFFSLTLLFLLPFIYIYSTGVIRDMNIVVVLVLAAAGAGGVQFMCLSKTDWGQTLALLVYIISNVVLGFILRKEGETFPKITSNFLIFILFLGIALWLISKIKLESIDSVLAESKTTLRGVFFPALYLLNGFYSDIDLTPWISSFLIQILVLLLLKFILKKEDEAPDGKGNQGETPNHGKNFELGGRSSR